MNGDDEPFAIQLITMCKESKVLAVVGASSHIILFRFSKIEVSTELSVSSTRASKRAGGVFDIPKLQCGKDPLS